MNNTTFAFRKKSFAIPQCTVDLLSLVFPDLIQAQFLFCGGRWDMVSDSLHQLLNKIVG